VQDNHYTIIVVPGTSGKARRYAISKPTVRKMLIGGAGLLVAGLAVGTHYLIISRELAKYRAESRAVQEEKAKIDSLSLALERLRTKMAKLQEFDHKLRIIADLPKIEETDESLGAGGTVIDAGAAMEAGLADFAERARGVQESIESLEQEAALQEDSFYDLIEFLEERKSVLLATPSIRPCRGWVTSGFGYRRDPFTGERELHRAVDIATRIGTPFVAAADGIVVSSEKDRVFGNIVEIDHGNGFVTRYGHTLANFVKKGDMVRRGQVIGTVGNTGRSTGPHLHYEIRLNGVAVNPDRYMLN